MRYAHRTKEKSPRAFNSRGYAWPQRTTTTDSSCLLTIRRRRILLFVSCCVAVCGSVHIEEAEQQLWANERPKVAVITHQHEDTMGASLGVARRTGVAGISIFLRSEPLSTRVFPPRSNFVTSVSLHTYKPTTITRASRMPHW